MMSQTYWHGSPHLIRDEYVVPGEALGIDRYSMGRNRAVFVDPRRETAQSMGAHTWNDAAHLPADHPRPTNGAMYLYEVEVAPEDWYTEADAPHHSILDHERQCSRARIVRRFVNTRPDRGLAYGGPEYAEFHIDALEVAA